MITKWMVLALVLVCAGLGYLVGRLTRKSEKKEPKQDGLLIVDEIEDPAQVYMHIEADPKTYKDKDIVRLEVVKIGKGYSQEKHVV